MIVFSLFNVCSLLSVDRQGGQCRARETSGPTQKTTSRQSFHARFAFLLFTRRILYGDAWVSFFWRTHSSISFNLFASVPKFSGAQQLLSVVPYSGRSEQSAR